jgi:hypothetical protein
MATTTVRPNANWSGNALFTLGGGASTAHGALSDTDDATTVQRTSATIPAIYQMEMDTTTLSATEKIDYVNLRIKMSQGVGGNTKISLGVITDRNGRTVYYSVPIVKLGEITTTTIDFVLNLTSAPNGSAWTQTLIDNLVVSLADDGLDATSRATFLEVFVDIVTKPQPTLTVSTPTGTVTTTSFPAVSWAYTNTSGDPQNAYQIKIYDYATYNAAGFSADTTTATLDTGIVISSADGAPLEVDLANSTVYRAYVKVASLLNGVRYFSEWAFSGFTMAVNSPATPSVSPFYDTTIGAVTLTIFGRTNFLSENQASLETDTTGWDIVSNCSIASSGTQSSDGSKSLRMTATASANMVSSTTVGTAFTVTPSRNFSATAVFRAGTTGRLSQVGIRYLDSTGATISTTYGTGITSTTSAFTEATATVLAPVTAATAQVFILITSAGTSEIHYVDKIGLHSGSTAVWSPGGFSAFAFDIERSDGGGAFSAIRNSPVSSGAGQIATLDDYEIPLDTTVIYRAKARADI